MITYEFTAPTKLDIFKHDPSAVTEDYVEAHLQITIPFKSLKKLGSDRVQETLEEEIKWAIKNVERRIS